MCRRVIQVASVVIGVTRIHVPLMGSERSVAHGSVDHGIVIPRIRRCTTMGELAVGPRRVCPGRHAYGRWGQTKDINRVYVDTKCVGEAVGMG